MQRDYSRGYQSVSSRAGAQATYGFMSRVYMLMTIGLVLTAFIAFLVSSSESLVATFVANKLMFLIMVVVEFGLVIWLTRAIEKMSAATATAGFIAYSVLNGVTLSVILLAYTGASVASTFVIAAGGFTGMSITGYITKKDLGAIGNFCLYALFGIIIASVVNWFLQSSGLQMIISFAGVIIFAGLTAYDTQKLKKLSYIAMDEESKGKYAVLGALELYLDFINFFLFLLRIFGNRR